MTTNEIPTFLEDVVFARMDGNTVIEYPVTLQEIQNRGAPMSMFRMVVDRGTKPEPKPFHRVVEKVVGENLTPIRTFEQFPLSLQEILNELWNHRESLTAAEVSPETFARVIELTRIEATARLDAFALTREYDDITSLCSYSTDPDPDFKAEGQRGVELRSLTWKSLREYNHAVATGKKPVPRLDSEIFAILPELTW